MTRARPVNRGGALLTVRGLDVDFRLPGPGRRAFTAVRGADLDVGHAEIVALVGESGSGKTSLARALLGLVEPAAGTLRLDGIDLAGPGRRDARRRIQAVFQDPLASLSPRRSVLQSVREPLDHLGGGSGPARHAAALAALEAVGLGPELAGRYPHELSGGQRQRVALARAIAPQPDLVIADEPLSSLDLAVQQRLLGVIRALRERTGIAFLFISHDLSVVRRLADRVAVMVLGRIVETGPVEALFARPAHPYTRGLLDAVAVPDPSHPPPRVPPHDPAPPLTTHAGCVFHSRCKQALPVCATRPPDETDVDPPGPEGEGHRTSCHLWSR